MPLVAFIAILAAGILAAVLAQLRKDWSLIWVVALIVLGLVLAYFVTGGTIVHSGH
jgi:hypothetical protein